MRVRVDEIPEAGRFLDFHWGQERLQPFIVPGDPHALNLVHPLVVQLEIHKEREHVHIAGSIRGSLRVTCDRCLETFAWPLEQTVDVFLIPGEEPEPDEEVELEFEELEYEFFDGEVINVDQLVAEQVFLALPFKTLCSEECQGICPSCGANRNLEKCRCGNQGQRSPFAVLNAVKGKLPAGPDAGK
jgi:uncharacterized protein